MGHRADEVVRGAGSVTSHKRVAEIDAGLARITVDEVVEGTSFSS